MLRRSSSTIRTFLPARSGSDLLALVEHLPGRRAEVGLDPVQEQGRLVDQVLQRPDVLDDRRLGHLVEPGLLLGGQVPAGVDDDPEALGVDLPLDRLQQLQAAHVGQAEVEHQAVERLRPAAPPAPRRPCRRP